MSTIPMTPVYHLRLPNESPVIIKNPDDFDFEWYRITDLNRLAGGDMNGKNVAIKRKWNLRYDVIEHRELYKIRQVIFHPWLLFYEFSFVEDNIKKFHEIYAGALKYKKFRTGSLWHYKDATLSLIER